MEDESRYDLETPGHDGPEADWLVLERGVHFDELVLSGRDLGSNDEVQTLHECVRLVQREIHPAGGSINKVVTDEKGTSILVAFGSRSARTLYDVGHAVVACVRALEAGGSCFISTWIGCRFPDCFDTIRAIRISCGA